MNKGWESLFTFGWNFFNIFFPVDAIKGNNAKLCHHIAIQAAEIDIKHVWVRSRTVEGMNATAGAEEVLCNPCVECVSGKGIRAAEESEAIGRNNQV